MEVTAINKLEEFCQAYKIPCIKINRGIENSSKELKDSLPRFFAWQKHENLRHSSFKGLACTIKRLIKDEYNIDKDLEFRKTINVINAILMFKAKDLNKQPLRERDAYLH